MTGGAPRSRPAWALVPLVAVLAGLGAWSGLGAKLDLLTLDQLMRVHRKEAPADILLVAIDEPSLVQFGRWPWPRSLHARLVERLSAAGARAIGLQLILAEPDALRPGDDARLAAAVGAAPVVLPIHPVVLPSRPTASEVLPLPELAAGAALGHVESPLDRDGLLRRLYLWAGAGEAFWPHLALAMLRLGGEAHLARGITPTGEDPPWTAGWVREMPQIVPFHGPPDHFRTLSYRDALADDAALAPVRGSYVLVGMTASGLGDSWPTPVSAGRRPMPGIEVSANLLAGLRAGTLVRELTGPAVSAFTTLSVLLAALGAARLRNLAAAMVLMPPLVIAASLVALRLGIWFPPLWAALGVAAVLMLLQLLRRRAEAAAAAQETLAREARLRRLEAELEHSARLGMVGQVSAAIAHELNQPLAALQAYAAACRRQLRRVDADPALEELLGKITGQADRVATILQRMRALFEQGREPELVAQNVDEVVAEAVQLALLGRRGRPLDLDLDLSARLPPVPMDRIQIQQVIVNLVRNAVEAMRDVPQPKLTVRTRLESDEQVAISVRDVGAGIDPAMRERLFEPFASDKAQGMGMGLYVSRAIIEAHHGHLAFAPAEGAGTVFHIVLPLGGKV